MFCEQRSIMDKGDLQKQKTELFQSVLVVLLLKTPNYSWKLSGFLTCNTHSTLCQALSSMFCLSH